MPFTFTSHPGVSCPHDEQSSETRPSPKCSNESWPWRPQMNRRNCSPTRDITLWCCAESVDIIPSPWSFPVLHYDAARRRPGARAPVIDELQEKCQSPPRDRKRSSRSGLRGIVPRVPFPGRSENLRDARKVRRTPELMSEDRTHASRVQRGLHLSHAVGA